MKWSVISFVLLVVASCQHRQEGLDPTLEGFLAEDSGEVRKPAQFVDAQAASGARADATLSKQHFDGGRLNSLGEDKLSRMMKDDDATEPMRVYLNVNERDPASRPRREAVIAFLKDGGLTDAQIEIAYGPNPENRSRASTHLSNLGKTETGAAAQSGGGSPAHAGEATPGQSGQATGGNELTGAGGGNLFK
jgi:hypothetical protein